MKYLVLHETGTILTFYYYKIEKKFIAYHEIETIKQYSIIIKTNTKWIYNTSRFLIRQKYYVIEDLNLILHNFTYLKHELTKPGS